MEFFRFRCLGKPWEKHRIERRKKTKIIKVENKLNSEKSTEESEE